MANYSRRKVHRRRRISLLLCIFALSVVLIAGILGISSILSDKDNSSQSVSGSSSGIPSSNTANSEIPFKETTVTVISTGDIMVHSTQLDGAYVSDGVYDFSAFFKEASTYFKKADLAIANLEVTFGGKEHGAFTGYPVFNTPDSLADVIKESGLNLLLTSNNHSYDTGLAGLIRTAKVLKEKGIEFIGTKEIETDPSYIVKKVNNINIGITDYTYETTGANSGGQKYLNGILLKEEANNLVNSFSYYDLDKFYDEAQKTIEAMKNEGAEFIVFYLHWGNEYQLNANTYQKAIAQELSNMGVDMIIGSHPHVVQPIELITSEDGQNSTVCLYSTGNAISNQRQELMNPECTTGHTEDGMLFYYTFDKYSDGTVKLSSVDIVPAWVDKKGSGTGAEYILYPLENENSYSNFSLTANTAKNSYNRTKNIVASGLTEIQQYLGCEVRFEH